MKNTNKLLSLVLALVMIFGCMSTLISCGDEEDGPKIDNESTRLVLASSELDGVFNPFYSSSAPDGNIVGMTQIGMLSSDKEGKVAYGKDEACVVLDYESTQLYDESGKNVEKTRYRFVLKNGLKFSNGSPLTMKDVLFNLYVYLDPAYYGSSTIYSTDIVGLEEYRTQSKIESEQEGFEEQFNALASDRIIRLTECIQQVYDDIKGVPSLSDAAMIEKLTAVMNEKVADGSDIALKYSTVLDDYSLIKKYLSETLKTVYVNSRGTASDIKYLDQNKQEIALSTDTEAFLFNLGYITWDDEKFKFDYSLGKEFGTKSEEEAINAVYVTYIPNNALGALGMVYTDIFTRFALLEKQAYFDSIAEKDRITSVSGIRFANFNETVSVNGVNYAVPSYADNGAVTSGNEVLEITINKVDPKAIWNFGFTVAPMYYYSSEEEIAKFDYEKGNFGVKFGSIDFQDAAIKNPDKIGVPVGAGAYKATTRTGDSSAVSAGTFKADNVVYFERNEHFMFDVKIKYVNYQVVATNLMLDALYSGDVHFVEPACKQENVKDIADKKADGKGVDSISLMTNGYGYIGINAEKVPDINVRRAIMHAINTELAVEYYFGYSHPINRPMTRASWAYPKGTDEEGQYYAFDNTGAVSEQLLIDAGYTKNSKGIYQKNGHVCKYVFTIAGDTTDHPAYASLKRAAEILNDRGFDIEVKTDINALKKLNNGDLTVWAAAWGAGVDPDMYQVYHIDSTAGSTANWGYRAIKANAGGKYDEELRMVKELSEIIEKARETLDIERRTELYADALDMVMELAVELPTYQRSDLYAFNTDVIDVSTMTPASERTPYNGPLSRIWELSLNEN